MQREESDTFWIGRLKSGSAEAAGELWERYFDRLVQYARTKLDGAPRRVADEEDVAASAFDSLCRGVRAGRFAELDDRHDLWQLLVMIAARKARRQIDRECCAKRGGGKVRGHSAFGHLGGARETPGIDQVVGPELTPETIAILQEESQRLLDALDDGSLRQVALLKMEGYTNQEVAEKQECKLRTVERKLRLIRQLWSREE